MKEATETNTLDSVNSTYPLRGHKMANRSYLYATNMLPGNDAKQTKRQVVGVSEWNYGIPIVYKLLLTGNPRTCKSSIWEMPDDIAIVGDYSPGVQRLKEFLRRIRLPAAQALIDEAVVFLEREESRKEHFLLECGEIFAMAGEPLKEQNSALLQQIRNLDVEIERALSDLPHPAGTGMEPDGLSSANRGDEGRHYEAGVDPLRPIRRLGLGYWSNVLFYDLSGKKR